MAKADLAGAVDSEGEEGGNVVLRGHRTVSAHLHGKSKNTPSGYGADVTGDVTEDVIAAVEDQTAFF